MASKLGFEPTDSRKYYFVSYNTEDNQRVSAVLKGLLEQGVPLWYDDGIEYGNAWEPTIAEHIDKCRTMILFVTKGVFAKGSKSYVKKEWELADFFGRKVVVIVMDEIDKKDISYDLISWWMAICAKQCIPASEYKDEALTKEIMKALGLKYKPQPLPNAKKDKFVYISYAGHDRADAEQLKGILEKQGIRVIMPTMDASAGWFDAGKLIEGCESVIALISEHALSSRASGYEIEYGTKIGKRVIPVIPSWYGISWQDTSRSGMYLQESYHVVINESFENDSEGVKHLISLIQ